MASYRVYRVGQDEHVRVAAVAAPGRRRRGARSRGGRRGGTTSSAASRRWLAVAAIAAAVVAILYWRYGSETVGNSTAALELAKLSGWVPEWAMVVAPVVVVAAVALVTVYLAFGHRLAVKLVGVAVVVVVLATPGLAVGYANGLISDVGADGTGTADKTAKEEAEIAAAEEEIDIPLPDKAMNILLIGSDKTDLPDDPGRSDTQMLVRLDPETKSISMLSLPRDLRVYIPDHGYDKMNTAYSYGGPKLVIKTFKEVTGLPVNAWIEIDFAGFWHVVNILGGVYLPIDHRYFVPASASYKSINLEAGYQLVGGKQSLNFVRFRMDQQGDFMRMQRQQLFVRELQRQSGRWSGDLDRVVKLIKAIGDETKSNLSSLKKLLPLVQLVFQVDTSKVYQAHLEGDTPMYDNISFVEASDEQIAAAVEAFVNPLQAPTKVKGVKVGKKMFDVKVYNGSGISGLATSAAGQLKTQGYRAEAVADFYEFPDTTTAVYAPPSLEEHAKTIAAMLSPANVNIVTRAQGTSDGVTVVIASSFDGSLVIPDEVVQEQQILQEDQNVDWATWEATDADTPLRLQAPTAWSPGFVYDEFRNYSIETTEGKKKAASVAVVRTSQGGYWTIQALRWVKPPAIENPTSRKTIAGRKYMLFYQGRALQMVAWKERGTLYWVRNTLDNQLSNDLMMGIAKSCKPVT